jgi:acyl-CoA thioesterase-1
MLSPRRFRVAALLGALAMSLAGCATAASGRPATPASTTTVVTIGDSIMAGQGLDQSMAWPQLLPTDALTKVVNLACSGAGFIAVGGCGTNYAGLIARAAAAQPTLVIVESSSNDMGQTDTSIDEATQATMAALRTALPKATIVALSTVWNEQSSWPAEVTSSSLSIQRAASVQHGVYLDLGQPLEGHPEWMQSDDVHPTADGQRALADSVRRALATVGLSL